MKKYYLLIVVLTISHSSFTQSLTLTPISLKWPGKSATRSLDTVLSSPALNSRIIVYEAGQGNFLTGTGSTATECFQKYSLGTYSSIMSIPLDTPVYVTKAHVFYGYSRTGSNPGNIYAKIYNVKYNSNANYNKNTRSYAGGYGPGDLLGTSDPISMADIISPIGTALQLVFTFSTPVKITQDSFFVSVLFSSNSADTLAIVSSNINDSLQVPMPSASWYVNSNTDSTGSYKYFLQSNGFGDIDLGIEPQISFSNSNPPPSCSSSFTIYPDTVPHVWDVSYQVTGTPPYSFVWNWGDSTTTTTGKDTTSHTYADSGYYTVCLTTTDASNCVSSFCDTSLHLYRTNGSNTMIKIVVAPQNIATGTSQVGKAGSYTIYPNPSTGDVVISSASSQNIQQVFITNALGQVVSRFDISNGNNKNISVHLPVASGLYFVHLKAATGEFVGKVIRE